MSPEELVESQIEVYENDHALGIGSGTAILIADDSPANLVAYEAALQPVGRPLKLVGSGVEALGALLEDDVALILLDVNMQDMSGIETARLLRARPRNRGTPIIFITGMTWDQDVVREAYELGAFDFIFKPIEPDILRAKVRHYLQLQDRTRDVQRQRRELREMRRQLEAEQAEHRRTHAADTMIARRLEKLQEATAGLAEAKTPIEVAEVATRLGAEAVAARAGVVWLLGDDGALCAAGKHAIPEDYIGQWAAIPPGSAHPVRRVFDRGEALWVQNADDFARDAADILDAARAARRVVAFAALPLAHAGKPLGVLAFSYEQDHAFSDDERRYLDTLARACEVALERARLYVLEAESRKRAEVESARKDEFLAMLGHELRNPLAAIMAAVEVYKLREPTLGRELSTIERHANHLARFVHDLVDVSRLTSGTISLHRAPIGVMAALQCAIDLVRSDLEHRQHALAIEVPPDLVVDADHDRLCQVFGNLLANAVKYTPPGGQLAVTGRRDGAFAELVIRDNGAGIDAALLPSIFDAFVQGAQDRARRAGGLGVGLTIVRKLVELHGGRVTAHSDGPWDPLESTCRHASLSIL